MGWTIDEVTGEVIDTAYRLHTGLGPGLLETAYEPLMAILLARRGLKVERQHSVAIEFEAIRLDRAFVIDLLVEDRIVVELKSVEAFARVHFKQVLTYLRLMKLPVGLLINFGAPTLKEGIKRIVNGYVPDGPSPLRIHQPGYVATAAGVLAPAATDLVLDEGQETRPTKPDLWEP